jgi:ribosomal protein L13
VGIIVIHLFLIHSDNAILNVKRHPFQIMKSELSRMLSNKIKLHEQMKNLTVNDTAYQFLWMLECME